jgi:hypothetical protein
MSLLLEDQEKREITSQKPSKLQNLPSSPRSLSQLKTNAGLDQNQDRHLTAGDTDHHCHPDQDTTRADNIEIKTNIVITITTREDIGKALLVVDKDTKAGKISTIKIAANKATKANNKDATGKTTFTTNHQETDANSRPLRADDPRCYSLDYFKRDAIMTGTH